MILACAPNLYYTCANLNAHTPCADGKSNLKQILHQIMNGSTM